MREFFGIVGRGGYSLHFASQFTSIEKAAYIPGVKRAEWDSHTQILTVIYRPSKTSVEKIETSIVAVGYDAGDMKATDEDYHKLPQCCAYREQDAHVHE